LEEATLNPLRSQWEKERQPTLPSRIVAHVRRDVPLVLLDAAAALAAYLIPLVLRFEGSVPSFYWGNFWRFVPFVALIYLLLNRVFGLYGHMWRYASVEEAQRVIFASISAGAVVILLGELMGGEDTRVLPLSVVVFGAFLALLGVGAIRFQSRLFAFRRQAEGSGAKRVMVVGAGDAGEMVLKDIIRNKGVGLRPVAVVDDDPRKLGRSLHGIRVLGTCGDIPDLAARLGVDQVILAIPSATGALVRDVVACCEQAEVVLKVLPSVRELVGGHVSVRDVRDLRIDDFLGREPVEIDPEAVGSILRGRRVLITGAGGSIGSEICHQVASFGPSELLLLDHDETHLYDISKTLRDVEPEILLADVRNRERIHAIFDKHRPEVVFHAAAHKHVPFLENHPEEAVLTNVIGTAHLADAALSSHVQRFVLISTDKAIRAASVMGASKWFAEQILWSLQGRNGCAFSAVRFGNVLGSRGSVIPTFFKQIARGEPVTITDPSMARYFMSVREAVQLVLQAAALATGGEVFTLAMGEPVTILDLARKVIRMSGRVPDKDVEISIVGARPGEKLVEEIVDTEEESVPSGHPSIYVSKPLAPDPRLLRTSIQELEGLATEGRGDELADRIKGLASPAAAGLSAGEAR
jgi:FlaA1/EpsC-like NDP-sugar epimerase